MIISILKKLYETIPAQKLSDKELFKESFIIDDIKFEELLSTSSLFPQFYWKSRHKKNTLLAFGHAQKVSLKNLPKEKFHIVGSTRFISEGQSPEWDSFEDEHLYVPMIVLERDENKTQITFYCSHLLKHAMTKMEAPPISFQKRNVTNVVDIPTKNDFLKKFKAATNSMNSNQVDKIVLARKRIYTTSSPVDSIQFLADTCTRDDCYTLLFRTSCEKSFLSFSPERLFLQTDRTIKCDSMAGTLPFDQDEKKLTQSKKNNKEQEFVTKDIIEKLNTICDHVELNGPPHVHKFKHVQHLHSTISGQLKKNIHWPDILRKIHPTPAVGGTPWKKAKKIIMEAEAFDRGHYAAPWGIVTENYSEFLVGIRSALIIKNQIHIYAGAGIVEGSEGEQEWHEMESKMQQFIQEI